MARKTVAPIDPEAAAAGFGELKAGPGYTRLVGADGKTRAYIKRTTVSVPAALVANAPKKLGTFKVDAAGRWATANVDTDGARRIIEHVVAQRGEES